MKERSRRSSDPASAPVPAARKTASKTSTGSGSPQTTTTGLINNSPRVIAQRRKLASISPTPDPATAQLQGIEEEEPVQGRFLEPATAQLQGTEEEEPLQGRFRGRQPLQRAARGADAPASNRTGLSDSLKSGIESLSGMDMSDVRVHRNSARPAQLNAHAFAQGSDIHLASGQDKHLAHEAWHVVQQKQGRVKPTMQMNSASINDDPSLESEADTMGARAEREQPDASRS